MLNGLWKRSIRDADLMCTAVVKLGNVSPEVPAIIVQPVGFKSQFARRKQSAGVQNTANIQVLGAVLFCVFGTPVLLLVK